MLIAAWSNFFGSNLQVHPKRLPDGIGALAQNMRLGFADLRPLKAPALAVTTGGATPLISAYRANRTVVSDVADWLQWTTDVDVVRSLIASDPTEEIYYTGDGIPKLTDNIIGLPAAPGPASWRSLGIPNPTAAMLAAVNTAGTAPNEDRVYVDTFINDKNRESAPGIARSITVPGGSTVDLSSLSAVPSGNHGIDRRRIYCSTDGGDYLLVREQLATLTTALDDLTRGSVLQSGGDDSKPAWLMPPTGLKGLIALWNGMIGGFFDKQFAVCVPGKPWAWPLEYQDTVHDDIVATGKWLSNWLILTTSSPVVLRGGPLLFDREPVPYNWACSSKRSVANVGHGVCWAGPSGLYYVGQNGAKWVTEGIISPEQWEAMVPSSIIGTRFERYYVGFYNDGQPKGFMIDPTDPRGAIFLTFGARGVYVDPISDRLYLQDVGNTIKRWNAGAALTASFRTPVVRHSYPTNPGYAMVIADDPVSVDVKLWADVLQPDQSRVWTLIDSRTVTAGEPFSLPGGYLSQDFQMQVDTASPVQGLMLAEDISDLV